MFGVLAVRPSSRLLLGLDTEAGQGGAPPSCCGTGGQTAVKQSTSSSVWTAAGPVLHVLSLQLSPLATHTPALTHGTRARGGVEVCRPEKRRNLRWRGEKIKLNHIWFCWLYFNMGIFSAAYIKRKKTTTTAKGQSVRLVPVHRAGPAGRSYHLIHSLLYQKLKSKNDDAVSNQKGDLFKSPRMEPTPQSHPPPSLWTFHLFTIFKDERVRLTSEQT